MNGFYSAQQNVYLLHFSPLPFRDLLNKQNIVIDGYQNIYIINTMYKFTFF